LNLLFTTHFHKHSERRAFGTQDKNTLGYFKQFHSSKKEIQQQNNKTTKQQQNNKTTKQQNNTTTKQQNNTTTKQQNNKTTKQHNNTTTQQQNNNFSIFHLCITFPPSIKATR
jgi:hypothetical protein